MAWLLELGLNPTREALIAQGAVIVLADRDLPAVAPQRQHDHL